MNADLALPMSAGRLIPHRPPMLLVDRLLTAESDSGTVEACFDSGSILVNSRGEVDEVVLVELLAQGYAAIKGYEDLSNGTPVKEGFLVGVRKLRISGQAFAGDRLLITIRTVGTFEGFAVVEGEIRRKDEIIAAGTLKLLLIDDSVLDGGRS